MALAAAGAPALALGRPGVAWPADPPIVKPLPPEWFIPFGEQREMRWEAMRGQGHTVANERFFVRNHTATPRIDASTWRLRVSGPGVRRPLELSYARLARPNPRADRRDRVCRQRPPVLRVPAGHARGRHPVGLGPSASRAGRACRGARCSSAPVG